MNAGDARTWRREARESCAKTPHQTVGQRERAAFQLNQDLAVEGGAHQAVRRMRGPHQQAMPDLVCDNASERPAEQLFTKRSSRWPRAASGLGVLASWAVEPEVRAGRLQARPLTRHGFKRMWSAATLKDMALVPYVSAFTDLLAEHRPFAPSLAHEAGANGRARGRRRRATKSGD